MSKSWTTAKSEEILYEITIKPGKNGVINAYQKSVYTIGTVPYQEFDSSVKLVSSESETISEDLIFDGAKHFDGREF